MNIMIVPSSIKTSKLLRPHLDHSPLDSEEAEARESRDPNHVPDWWEVKKQLWHVIHLAGFFSATGGESLEAANGGSLVGLDNFFCRV